VSALRARCPDCRTLTAVALGPVGDGAAYQCHSCGREFAAGLVRVPRAWGSGGEAMAEAAWTALPYPEAEVVEQDTLEAEIAAVAANLPDRPLVLGGCCCSHVGAAQELARRHPGLSILWLDAHGDLNTPETSPSGNAWGMPLRMIIESGAVPPGRVCLVGARNLDPPEQEYIAASGVQVTDCYLSGPVYVALDCDVLDVDEVSSFMPEPGGLSVSAVERILSGVEGVVGMGVTGLRSDPRNVEPVTRLVAATLP
jgi:arginase family enzyme